MSSYSRIALLLLALGLLRSLAAQDDGMQLGVPVTEAELAGFDLIAAPDGSGFPPGSGSVRDGREIYNNRCAGCHGLEGEGVSGNTVLVGGDMQSPGPPLRTVGSFWPHASTLYDFVRRAMPADAPKSLDDEEVYAVIAYVLYLNDIVDENTVLDADSLRRIEMPNAGGFIDQSHLQ